MVSDNQYGRTHPSYSWASCFTRYRLCRFKSVVAGKIKHLQKLFRFTRVLKVLKYFATFLQMFHFFLAISCGWSLQMYKFAGSQNGVECWCGNDYGRFGKSNMCTKKCRAEYMEICGGKLSNTVMRAFVPGKPKFHYADFHRNFPTEKVVDTNRFKTHFMTNNITAIKPF